MDGTDAKPPGQVVTPDTRPSQLKIGGDAAEARGVASSDQSAAEAELHKAIGDAITQWVHVEGALLKVFKVVSTCQSEADPAQIFYSHEKFLERVEITNAAAQQSLSERDLKRWEKLKGHLTNGANVRNDLAHFGTALTVYPAQPAQGVTATSRLSAENVIRRQRKRRARHEYNTAQIMKQVHRFETLREKLEAFAKSLNFGSVRPHTVRGR